MMRWMSGETRKDEIRNEHFRVHLGVATIGDSDKTRDTHLRWFGHLYLMPATAPLKKKKKSYASWWPTKEKGSPEEDMDVSSTYSRIWLGTDSNGEIEFT